MILITGSVPDSLKRILSVPTSSSITQINYLGTKNDWDNIEGHNLIDSNVIINYLGTEETLATSN